MFDKNSGRQIADPDETMLDLYAGGRKWLYAGLIFLFMIVCGVLHNSLVHDRWEGKEAGTARPIIRIMEHGHFISSNQVYEAIKKNMKQLTGDRFLTNMDGEGGLGFYRKGQMHYTYSFVCMDKNQEYLEWHLKKVPDTVAFIDYSSDKPRPDHVAYFVQAFFDDMDYDEIVAFLREDYDCWDKEAGSDTVIMIRGIPFHMQSTEEDRQVQVYVQTGTTLS